MRNALNAAIFVSAIALPMLAFSPNANADTLKEVTTRGIVFSVSGMDVDVTYTPDGKYTAFDGEVVGKWRIEGDKLCTSDNIQTEEICVAFPKDKKSGDVFEVTSDQGTATIRIK